MGPGCRQDDGHADSPQEEHPRHGLAPTAGEPTRAAFLAHHSQRQWYSHLPPALSQFTFASGGSDKIKKWQLPKGKFLQNLEGHKSIINCMALNADDVLVSGGDNGTLSFWDYTTGYVSAHPRSGCRLCQCR